MSRIALFFFVACLVACTNPDHATRVLQDAGYSEIKLTGYRWMGCSKDDHYADGFEAKGPTGHHVTGIVCSGLLFKGATIRVD